MRANMWPSYAQHTPQMRRGAIGRDLRQARQSSGPGTVQYKLGHCFICCGFLVVFFGLVCLAVAYHHIGTNVAQMLSYASLCVGIVLVLGGLYMRCKAAVTTGTEHKQEVRRQRVPTSDDNDDNDDDDDGDGDTVSLMQHDVTIRDRASKLFDRFWLFPFRPFGPAGGKEANRMQMMFTRPVASDSFSNDSSAASVEMGEDFVVNEGARTLPTSTLCVLEVV